jgi:acyl-CoA thioester hydrolase
MIAAPHRWPIRVYYEDTDLAGIVYYANYLRYIERARSEAVRARGIDQVAMRAAGVVFAVRRVVADYLRPARYDDLLEVETRLGRMTPARFVM